MKNTKKPLYFHAIIAIFLSIAIGVNPIAAQPYDILIKGGHMIDPKNDINMPMDIAISDGLIAAVAPDIPESQAAMVISAANLFVAPGLIDMHVHVFHGTQPNAYLCNSFSSLPPDAFTFRSGVTTVVDAGCAGWRNYEIFKSQTIDQSKTRVLSILNIVGYGMAGGPIEQNLKDMDPEKAAEKAAEYPGEIVGIKLAHYSGPEWEPVDNVTKAGQLANLPVMIDFGGNKPPLSIETLFLEKLRAGDIFTHAYAHVGGRMAIVDDDGKVRPVVRKAREKGIIFDVGHGGGSFVYEQAIPALEQGFKPDAISTDLHTGSMNGGMKDQLNVMSKFLNLGMSLEEVIDCSSRKPATIIKREDLGHLSVGAEADIAILSVQKGDFGFTDTRGWKMKGTQKLVAEVTLRKGEVVWDLNGLSYKDWQGSANAKDAK